jgi:uncharacterized protein (DUF427 family)
MHEIKITPAAKRLRVTWQGKVIADTMAALDLAEASYPVVKYVPLADVDMSALARTAHQTRCPYKGDASYYSLVKDGSEAKNAVWTYETPLDGVAAIKDHVAFYPNQVSFEEG